MATKCGRAKNDDEVQKKPAGPRPSMSFNTLFLEFNKASPYIFGAIDRPFIGVVDSGDRSDPSQEGVDTTLGTWRTNATEDSRSSKSIKKLTKIGFMIGLFS